MIQRHYKPDSRFTHVVITDELTDPQLNEHVVAFNDEAAERKGLLELADCRHLIDISTLTASGCVRSAMLEENQPRVHGGKLAILVQNELQFGMARAYSTAASSYRDSVHVFYDLQEALDWLQPDESIGEVIEFIASNVPTPSSPEA